MHHSPIISFRARFVLTVLLSGVMLTMGLFRIGGQTLSWAAPAQNPHLQTVPTRLPDDPPPPPPDSGPPAPPSKADEDNDTSTQPPEQTDNNEDESQPTQPPEQIDNGSQDEVQPSQPPEQTDNGSKDEVQPTQSPKEESDENKNQAPPALSTQGEGQVDGTSAALPQADLSLSQTVDNPTPNLGEVITFTIVISNNGPSNATHVIVSDPLPVGLSLSSTLPSQGSYNSGMGLWLVETITHSESVTLSLVVTVTSAGIMTNTAEITAAYPSDPDSTPGNGLEREDDWASVPIVTSLTTQFGSATFVSTSASGSGSFLEWGGSLIWLYALGLGVILILVGTVLVNRA